MEISRVQYDSDGRKRTYYRMRQRQGGSKNDVSITQREKNAFQSGTKLIAILSVSAVLRPCRVRTGAFPYDR